MNLHMHYTPLFSGIIESSLWDEPDYVCKVFLTMLALKERDHVVRKHLGWIAMCARKTEEETAAAIKVLSEPDKKRPGQEHEGRRLRKVEDGWLVLNGENYQKQMQVINQRARQAKYLEKKKGANRMLRQSGYGSPLKGEIRGVMAIESGDHDLADKIAAGEA